MRLVRAISAIPAWAVSAWLFGFPAAGHSQAATVESVDTSALEQLRAEIAALRADYERRIAELERGARQLAAELAVVQGGPGSAPEATQVGAAPLAPPAPLEPLAPLVPINPPPLPSTPSPPPTTLQPPITILSGASGKNFLNLSLDGLLAAGTSTAEEVDSLQTGGHDPSQRGFTVQNVEAVFEGAVDPYFRGQANVIFQIDADGETVVELEEAFLTSTSLPHGLQLKAGQFLSEFGRLNPSHPHNWDFVDQPLVNGRMFGPDGLRSVGARVSWLIPTDFFSEATLALQNGHGETLSSFGSVPGETQFGRDVLDLGVSSLSDLLVVPRYAVSFDLSETQTLLLGASAALGPNGTGPAGSTQIYGVDAFWKWKPTNAFRGFPFLKFQGELMRRRAELDPSADGSLPPDSLSDWGGYLQASWGFRPGYVAGLRVDRVDESEFEAGGPAEPGLGARWRLSPALTWFPTEYSKLRLQYNFDRSDVSHEDEHSFWLQIEFLLGAHAAHKF